MTYSDLGVNVETADGAILAARRVIVTLPLGVLKAGDVAFQPPLPERKLIAMQHLQMGVLDKVCPNAWSYPVGSEPYWYVRMYLTLCQSWSHGVYLTLYQHFLLWVAMYLRNRAPVARGACSQRCGSRV